MESAKTLDQRQIHQLLEQGIVPVLANDQEFGGRGKSRSLSAWIAFLSCTIMIVYVVISLIESIINNEMAMKAIASYTDCTNKLADRNETLN